MKNHPNEAPPCGNLPRAALSCADRLTDMLGEGAWQLGKVRSVTPWPGEAKPGFDPWEDCTAAYRDGLSAGLQMRAGNGYPGKAFRLVVLESPFSGGPPENISYLQECIRDSLRRGESPYASHQMLTSALDDLKFEERRAGMTAGWAWLSVAQACVVYEDLGITEGMMEGVARAHAWGLPVEYRRIRA